MTIQILSIADESNRNSSLNPLSRKTRTRLGNEIRRVLDDDSVTSIVLHGGRNFSAGADISEFNNEDPDDKSPSIPQLCDLIETSNKPFIALITGYALGGGLELAMGCHYRIACSDAKLGLPEVKIGLIPGGGGTQRLTRLSRDVKWSVEVITSGRTINPTEAKKKCLIDEIVPPNIKNPMDTAQRWANYASLLNPIDLPRARSRNVLLPTSTTSLSDAHALCDFFLTKRLPPKDRGGEAAHACVNAIRASFALDNRNGGGDKPNTFESGMAVEEELFWDLLLNGKQGRALRYAFFNDRAAGKIHGSVQHTRTAQTILKGGDGVSIGVIGAGTMGAGIAVCFLRAGYRVVLLDKDPAGLARGKKTVEGIIQQDVGKKRLTKAHAFRIIRYNFVCGTDMASPNLSFAKCSLVVEAVFENLAVKRAIFAQIAKILTDPEALIVSNTSTLSIDSIASALPESRRPFCAGMHFFSPAHVMKLVEIVRSSESSDSTLAVLKTVVSKKLKKVGVTVGNCEGFVGNRMLAPYTWESTFVLEEGGSTVEGLDGAIKGFGMALGPMAMGDLAGNDVGYLIRKSKGFVKVDGLVPRGRPERYSDLGDDIVATLGRLGQKVGKGWYDYNPKVGRGRVGINSPEVSKFIASYRSNDDGSGSSVPKPYSAQEIVERVFFPLVNEGFKILEEGYADRPADIDVIYLYGYGWPAWRGGPIYWANAEVGLEYLLTRLEEMNRLFPGSTYYVPSKLLRACVALGMTVMEYYEKGLHKKKQSLLAAKL